MRLSLIGAMDSSILYLLLTAGPLALPLEQHFADEADVGLHAKEDACEGGAVLFGTAHVGEAVVLRFIQEGG